MSVEPYVDSRIKVPNLPPICNELLNCFRIGSKLEVYKLLELFFFLDVFLFVLFLCRMTYFQSGPYNFFPLILMDINELHDPKFSFIIHYLLDVFRKSVDLQPKGSSVVINTFTKFIKSNSTYPLGSLLALRSLGKYVNPSKESESSLLFPIINSMLVPSSNSYFNRSSKLFQSKSSLSQEIV
jgi:hypothetical protein